jgi:hypothetical protein
MQITSSTSLFRALHLQYDSALIKFGIYRDQFDKYRNWEYRELNLKKK